MYLPRRQNKYGGIRQTYNGYSYMSKKEAQKAYELDLLVKAKQIKSYKRQFKLSLDVNGVHITNYFVDFLVENRDGGQTALEIKGFETDVWRMKWKLAQALYGDRYEFVVEK